MRVPIWGVAIWATIAVGLVLFGASIALPIGRQLGAGAMAFRVLTLEDTADSLRGQLKSLPNACRLPLPATSRTK